MIKNITIVSCHSRVGGNLDTCFRRYDTKFVSPNSIGFTIALCIIISSAAFCTFLHKMNMYLYSSRYLILLMC
ncbi:hypothetical protein [Candidatus Tisiphia endosymbiont of Hybos culiciformis]|uniref:hypothetical protein n=1 Tax=Candidatus Tisiphia endosymbiont of Hybos culiciformis TaxID=3139331 RepID=UPI003CCAA360